LKVNKRIRTAQGETEINCEFTEEEADVIFTVGLTRLLEIGAIPFTMIKQEEAAKFAPGGNG
jgi:hypothetical protein